MTILFLDIDGTINALSGRPPKKNTHWAGEWRWDQVDGMWVLCSRELVEELTQLSLRDDVKIVWLTDWRHKALEFGAAVGLPEFEYTPATEDEIQPDANNWWKLAHVQEAWRSDPDGKIIWLDDGIQYDPKSHWWEMGRDRLLTISPYQSHGLTRKHLKMINEFLDS